jgi:sensor domain CHASE-containing protein
MVFYPFLLFFFIFSILKKNSKKIRKKKRKRKQIISEYSVIKKGMGTNLNIENPIPKQLKK